AIRGIAWEARTEALAGASLLVNATSLGMEGQPPLDLPLDSLPRDAVVNDIVYVPLETDLLARARARGNPAVDGLGMLLHQARPGFEGGLASCPRSRRSCARRCSRRSGANETRPVKILGLTGGVGMGKSTAAAMLR